MHFRKWRVPPRTPTFLNAAGPATTAAGGVSGPGKPAQTRQDLDSEPGPGCQLTVPDANGQLVTEGLHAP
jgi:hypothetical protein